MANRLIHETSPYLLQHAHNPVDWYPWGDEAFRVAREQDKPVLVSIGYAACHWCHVMEHESFEDEATATLMNEYFINIKVDREERPDVDHLYMDALQAMTGSGGWPLNVFLLPDGRPFYGGTYFPPVRHYNRISWKELLETIHTAYSDKRTELEAQSANLVKHLVQANSFGESQHPAEELFTQENLDIIASNILQQADTEWGGFGRAPKFPQTFTINYLLRHHYQTGDPDSLEQALLSLDKMISGGLYDQLGGGFARYSTDAQWLAPHFEKMLYDNALLLCTLADAYKLTKNPQYRQVIVQTIDFLERELSDGNGAFYSALDADSEGIEGKFYTWTKAEIKEVLGDDSELFCEVYNVLEQGNWHDAPAAISNYNILWQTDSLDIIAEANGLTTEVLDSRLQAMRQRLLVRRDSRVRPLLDDKVLVNWNALCIVAYCKAAQALRSDRYIQKAEQAVRFIEEQCFVNNVLMHSYKNQVAKIPAFLDDYAYLIQAYLSLQEVTGNQQYVTKAAALCEYVIVHFSDENDCFFYFTPATAEDIIVRKKETYDGAVPSGNSVMATNLVYLSVLLDKPEWKKRAQDMLEGLGKTIIRYPTSFGVWASLFQWMTNEETEIVITGSNAGMLAAELQENYVWKNVFQWSTNKQDEFSLLKDRYYDNNSYIYICKSQACAAPVTTVRAALELLKAG
jgi:uncharacterized protein